MSPAATTTTTADGSKGSKKGHTKSGSSDGKDKMAATKICHIVKRADFDGYGFNLQTERSRPGQYIGKVDEHSPAEAAGLREGYRVIEVNGIPVNNESHKQVVQRIKAIAWEVNLLVATDVNDNETSPPITPTLKTFQKDANMKSGNNDNKIHVAATDAVSKHSKFDPKSERNGKSEPPASMAMTMMKTTSTPVANKSLDHVDTARPHVDGHGSVKATSAPSSLTSSPRAAAEGDASSASSNAQKPQSSLKLPSTAAEMRAILQSKKKFNPKSEDVDLQKKYEIIQKL